MDEYWDRIIGSIYELVSSKCNIYVNQQQYKFYSVESEDSMQYDSNDKYTYIYTFQL